MKKPIDIVAVALEAQGYLQILHRFKPPYQGQNPRILSLFCGAAVEEPALFAYFGANSQITSIDSSLEHEQTARLLGRKTFVRGNIERVEDMAEGTYDVILMRNPPIEDDGSDAEFKPWKELLAKLPQGMHRRSILIMTLLNIHEYRIVPGALERIGYLTTLSEHIPFQITASGIGTPHGGDYVIIMAYRPNWFTRLAGKMMPEHDF